MTGRGIGCRPAVIVSCGILLLLSGPVHAGETEARVEVDAIVPPLQRLEIDPLILVTPEIQAEDLAAGYAWLPRPVVLTVSSNVVWDLSIRWASDGKVGEGDGAGAVLLEWRAGNGAFRPLTEEWATVLADRGPAGAERFELNLRIPLHPGESKSGVYEPRLEYRLAPAGE